MTPGPRNLITDVPGLRVGNAEDHRIKTGTTVLVADKPFRASVDVMGGSPGTRETDLLAPDKLVDGVDALVLSGGSAYGLDAASGVSDGLRAMGRGFTYADLIIPIVPAAILFDLPVGGNPKIRPTADCGYKAAQAANTAPVTEGDVGAGAGATVGKLGGFSERPGSPMGQRGPMKSGIGSFALRMPNGLIVGAIVAVNAVGDIIDPDSGRIVAGALTPEGQFADARKILRSGALARPRAAENTTIGVVATNAKLTKAEAGRMALMADDGYARAIYPSHTNGDGDTVFSLATGRWSGEADISVVGALAAEAMAQAVVRAATQATGIAGLPAARDLPKR